MPNSRRLKTAAIAIVIGRFISGCVLEKKFETPEEARITTDVGESLAQPLDLQPPRLIQAITAKQVSRFSGLLSGGLGVRETKEIARLALGVRPIATHAAAINDPACPPIAATVDRIGSADGG